MANQDRIGARVAAIRKLRGWTGRELARRASVSYSLLAKVESGAAPATPAFIGAVARALRVDVPKITGQPYEGPGGREAALQATVDPLRRALLTYDVPPLLDVPARSASELTADVRAVSLLGRQARYLQLGQRLPVLLGELQAAVAIADNPERSRLYALLAEAYGGVSGLAHQLGYGDLRALALDRIEWASRQSGDPLRIARTQWSRGASLLGAAVYDQGLSLIERTRTELGGNVAHMDEPTRSVYGSLHLRSPCVLGITASSWPADGCTTVTGTVRSQRCGQAAGYRRSWCGFIPWSGIPSRRSHMQNAGPAKSCALSLHG